MPSGDRSEGEGTELWCSWWSKLTPNPVNSGVRRRWDGGARESNDEDCSGTDRWGGAWSLYPVPVKVEIISQSYWAAVCPNQAAVGWRKLSREWGRERGPTRRTSRSVVALGGGVKVGETRTSVGLSSGDPGRGSVSLGRD